MTTPASVVVTAKDEPPDRLERLLAALARQDLDSGLEVVISVPSEQRDRLGSLRPRGAVRSVVVIENPGGGRSTGLNRAVLRASHPLVCRMDARSLPPPEYVRRCALRLIADPGIGMVGGSQMPRAVGPSWLCQGVARALSNPWLLGGAPYRRLGTGGPVDTVYLGAFRRDELLALGGYDARLDANEDFDLAQRYRAVGRTVWLEQGLGVGYEARGRPRDVFRQYRAFGRSKVRYWRVSASGPNARQAVALVLATTAVAVGGWSALRPRRLVGAACVGVAAMAVVDHLGSAAPAGARVRAAAAVTSLALTGGWLSGIVSEALSGGRRERRRPATVPGWPPSPLPRPAPSAPTAPEARPRAVGA